MADTKRKLHGHEAGLRGLTWVYGLNHRFAANPHWSNQHCAICYDEFKQNCAPDSEVEGYTSLGGQYWICKICFHDFKDKLDWTVHNWD